MTLPTMTQSVLSIFNSGETYADFHARVLQGDDVEAARALAANEAFLARTDLDLTAFEALPRPLRVLVLEEDWCGDSLQHLPILDRIARDTGKLELRMVKRDDHLDLLNQQVKRSIPLVLFLNDEGNVGGVFIERPERVNEMRAKQRAEIHAQHPEFGGASEEAGLSAERREQLNELVKTRRQELRTFAIEEAVREFGEQATLAGA